MKLCILSLGLVIVGFSQVESTSLGHNQMKKSLCYRNMPCRWVLCPWSRVGRVQPEQDPSCVPINNEACQCPGTTTCTLSPNIDPLTANGAPFIKYEYRCSGPNSADYEAYYGLSKRAEYTATN